MKTRGRTTISAIMLVIAAAALMASSLVNRDSPFNDLLVLSLLIFLPVYLLVNFRRAQSSTEMALAGLAAAYLAWCASLRFGRLYPPRHWVLIDSLRMEPSEPGYFLVWRTGSQLWRTLEMLRWNWGLLATFYGVILATGVARRIRKRPLTTGLGGLPQAPERALKWTRHVPAGAELVPALWFLCHWHHGSCPVPDWSYGPCAIGAPWCGWLSLLGGAGWLLLAVVDRRRRPRSWRLQRSAARVARVVPAAMAGIATGLIWSRWRWTAAAGTTALLVFLVGQDVRCLTQQRRRPIPVYRLATFWVFLLAMFWGVAVSITVKPTPILKIPLVTPSSR